MGQLTQFQNQVLDAAEAYEQEQQEKKREEMREQQGGGGPQRNARAGGSGGNSDMGSEETVRYVNKEENPDHEVHD